MTHKKSYSSDTACLPRRSLAKAVQRPNTSTFQQGRLWSPTVAYGRVWGPGCFSASTRTKSGRFTTFYVATEGFGSLRKTPRGGIGSIFFCGQSLWTPSDAYGRLGGRVFSRFNVLTLQRFNLDEVRKVYHVPRGYGRPLGEGFPEKSNIEP